MCVFLCVILYCILMIVLHLCVINDDDDDKSVIRGHKRIPTIGVNAAGVTGVRTPPIFDLQGSISVLDPCNYFRQCN